MIKKYASIVSAVAVFGATATFANPARSQEANPSVEQTSTNVTATDFLLEATEIFASNQSNPETRIPDELLAEAEAIMIFRAVEGGIILGAGSGQGVAFKNNGDNWSPPAFYSVEWGSVGLRLGAQQNDVIALIMSDEGLNMLYQTTANWGMGVDAVAGPTSANAGTSSLNDADILVYTTNRGLDVGVQITGGTISPDLEANAQVYETADLYSRHNATPEWILGSNVPMPAEAIPLTNALHFYSLDKPWPRVSLLTN